LFCSGSYAHTTIGWGVCQVDPDHDCDTDPDRDHDSDPDPDRDHDSDPDRDHDHDSDRDHDRDRDRSIQIGNVISHSEATGGSIRPCPQSTAATPGLYRGTAPPRLTPRSSGH